MPQGDLLQTDVRGKLRRLRAAIRARLVSEGLAWLVMSLVALVFVTLGLDYRFRVDRPLRGVIMAAAAVGLAWVLWRQLVCPLRVSMGPAALALLVERRWGQLGDRLISALQFSQREDLLAMGMSEAMILRTADDANALAKPLNFQELIERRKIRQLAATATLAAVLLAWFSLWQTNVMSLWFQRNVLFAEVDWPQDTYLQVLGEPFTVLRGGDLTVRIIVKEGSVAPPYVTIHASYPSVGSTEERIEPTPEDREAFVKVFQGISEEFDFYVTGGDDSLDKRHTHKVRLIDPPALREVRFKIHYHKYTGRTVPEDVDGGRAVIGVPVGSRVEVYGKANKDLKSAAILLDGSVVAPMRISGISVERREGTFPRGLAGEFYIGGENRAAARTLQFALKDTDGYSNPLNQQQYMVQVQPDLAPVLEVHKQAVGAVLTPRAIIPLLIQAKDDNGIEVLRVLVAVGGKPAQAIGEEFKPPADDRKDVRIRREVDIDPLKLEPGNVIRVSAAAEDMLPKDFGGPNAGASATLDFRIVKPEDLMADLIRRQKELTIEFMQAISLQDQARAKTEGAADELAAGLSPEVQRKVEESGRLQGTVGSECAKAVDTLSAILDEMKYNRLGGATDYNAMTEGIIKPIQDLADPIRNVAGALNQTSDALKAGANLDAAKLREQTAKVADLQKDIRVRMEEILQRMQRLEGQLELANQLKVIIDWSAELEGLLKNMADQKVGGVFDPTTTQPNKPEPK